MLYIGGFAGYAFKVEQKPVGVELLPHRAFWTQVAALTMDGIAFSRVQFKEYMDSRAAAQTGYVDIEGGAPAPAAAKAPAAVAGEGVNSEDSDDD